MNWGWVRVVIWRSAGEKELGAQRCIPKRVIRVSKFHPHLSNLEKTWLVVSKGRLRTKFVFLKGWSLIKARKLETFYQQYLAHYRKLKNKNKNKTPNPYRSFFASSPILA